MASSCWMLRWARWIPTPRRRSFRSPSRLLAARTPTSRLPLPQSHLPLLESATPTNRRRSCPSRPNRPLLPPRSPTPPLHSFPPLRRLLPPALSPLSTPSFPSHPRRPRSPWRPSLPSAPKLRPSNNRKLPNFVPQGMAPSAQYLLSLLWGRRGGSRLLPRDMDARKAGGRLARRLRLRWREERRWRVRRLTRSMCTRKIRLLPSPTFLPNLKLNLVTLLLSRSSPRRLRTLSLPPTTTPTRSSSSSWDLGRPSRRGWSARMISRGRDWCPRRSTTRR
ncbi:hypothetical protein BCR35DRAFT_303362 [Leucosporidium creatinivorum]|uniref:Uncharacterized protein n=1 Tax=Leucosporidium creatinivorum TaxID=106004 RepID=A0A1Y2FHU2_9BASI|nr:hypothetical protein BCR35DRAFT_303362 [Leucosporidium creatinivorum]